MRSVFVAALVLMVSGGVGLFAYRMGIDPQGGRSARREVVISARKYAFDPPVIRVSQGDTIALKLRSEDVVHGFYLEGYDLDAEIVPERPDFTIWHPSVTSKRSGVHRGGISHEEQDEEELDEETGVEQVEEYTFVADRAGKFRYRCSHTCGYLHPFMQGELVVSPNYLYWGGLGMTVFLAGGLLLCFARRGRKEGGGDEG